MADLREGVERAKPIGRENEIRQFIRQKREPENFLNL